MWATILTLFTDNSWNEVSDIASGDTLGILKEESSSTEGAVGFTWTDGTVVDAWNALKLRVDILSSGADAFAVWSGGETWKAEVAAVFRSAFQTVWFASLAISDWVTGKEVTLRAWAGTVVGWVGSGNTLSTFSGAGTSGTTWWAWLADSSFIIETFLADTSVLRNSEVSVGWGNTLNADLDSSGIIAVLAVGIGSATVLDTWAVLQGRVTWGTEAGLVAGFIKTVDSVQSWVAVETESWTGAFLAFGVAFSADDGVVSLDDLIVSTGADTLTVDQGSVVFGETWSTGRGVGAGLANWVAGLAGCASIIIETGWAVTVLVELSVCRILTGVADTVDLASIALGRASLTSSVGFKETWNTFTDIVGVEGGSSNTTCTDGDVIWWTGWTELGHAGEASKISIGVTQSVVVSSLAWANTGVGIEGEVGVSLANDTWWRSGFKVDSWSVWALGNTAVSNGVVDLTVFSDFDGKISNESSSSEWGSVGIACISGSWNGHDECEDWIGSFDDNTNILCWITQSAGCSGTGKIGIVKDFSIKWSCPFNILDCVFCHSNIPGNSTRQIFLKGQLNGISITDNKSSVFHCDVESNSWTTVLKRIGIQSEAWRIIGGLLDVLLIDLQIWNGWVSLWWNVKHFLEWCDDIGANLGVGFWVEITCNEQVGQSISVVSSDNGAVDVWNGDININVRTTGNWRNLEWSQTIDSISELSQFISFSVVFTSNGGFFQWNVQVLDVNFSVNTWISKLLGITWISGIGSQGSKDNGDFEFFQSSTDLVVKNLWSPSIEVWISILDVIHMIVLSWNIGVDFGHGTEGECSRGKLESHDVIFRNDFISSITIDIELGWRSWRSVLQISTSSGIIVCKIAEDWTWAINTIGSSSCDWYFWASGPNVISSELTTGGWVRLESISDQKIVDLDSGPLGSVFGGTVIVFIVHGESHLGVRVFQNYGIDSQCEIGLSAWTLETGKG
jgi:hypothetical protein